MLILSYITYICEKNKSYVDDELVKIQIDLMKKNENEHKNTPDPIYSVNEAESGKKVIRRTLTNCHCFRPFHLLCLYCMVKMS